jgi:hypothetical protein
MRFIIIFMFVKLPLDFRFLLKIIQYSAACTVKLLLAAAETSKQSCIFKNTLLSPPSPQKGVIASFL